MPRDGSGIYSQPFPDVVEGTTIESAVYNGFTHDVEIDLNTPRPILAGGTGASSADEALDNLKAEKFKQVVTNWDTTVWRAGSFYAATTAIGIAPVAGHAFAGIVYYANATDLVTEATDLTDPINPTKYIRIMTAGVWGNWLLAAGGSGTTGDYTFDNNTTFPPASGQIRFNNAVENLTTEIFISHLNALGVDNTGTLSASLKSGYDLFIQDKDEPTKYKIFTATAAPVISGGDFRITVGLKTAGVDIVSGQRVSATISTGSAVVYDVAQGLTSAQMSQARANIAVTKKNYIINGAMQISQENGAAIGGATGYYPVDQFSCLGNLSPGACGVLQAAGTTPGGSPNRLQVYVSVVDASITAAEYLQVIQSIEGLRVADLLLGTPQAKTFTLQFGVKAPAGTYCVAVANAAGNRGYIAEYVISAGEANTDVVRSVTIPGDTTGTWAKDNTAGLVIHWTLAAGTNFQFAAGSWLASNVLATANQSNFLGNGANIFYLFDVSLTEGAVAPPFQVPDYASELALCQRYFEWCPFSANWYAHAAGIFQEYPVGFVVNKRGVPTLANLVADPVTTQSIVNLVSNGTRNATLAGCSVYLQGSAIGVVTAFGFRFSANARL